MAAVNQLAEDMLALLHDQEPVVASLHGLPGYDDQLRDYRQDTDLDHRARAERIAEQAKELGDLPASDEVTRAVIIQQATALMDTVDSGLVEHTTANPFVAPAGRLLVNLSMLRPLGDAAEESYLNRLAAIPDYLGQVAVRHRAGLASGRVPVGHHIRAAVAYLDRYLADPAQDPLLGPELSGPRVSERERLLAEIVRPAFASYREVLDTEITPHGRPDDRPGLSWLPDGEETYRKQIRVHTTTERSPEELHRTGLELIERLAEEYAEIGSRVFGRSTAAEVMRRLRTDAALRWHTAEEMLNAAGEAIRRAEAAAPDWFGRVPAGRCALEPIPDNEAPSSAPGYYMMPAMDGSRPGTYFINTYRPEERDRFFVEALTFHEAIPGHHFQRALDNEFDDLPLLRRTARINAFSEGWGLYSERLADEMGLYSSDLARLGMLAQDSMRAARLVVDTGLHALGWSREQVVEFLRANTVMPEVDIQAETDRYIEWPGQALSYMVGRLEIQRVRADAERALGASFDIKAFHDTVLGQGSVPLSVLSDVVSAWATSVAR
jgi:uncharacterized protein (DUF885 family)